MPTHRERAHLEFCDWALALSCMCYVCFLKVNAVTSLTLNCFDLMFTSSHCLKLTAAGLKDIVVGVNIKPWFNINLAPVTHIYAWNRFVTHCLLLLWCWTSQIVRTSYTVVKPWSCCLYFTSCAAVLMRWSTCTWCNMNGANISRAQPFLVQTNKCILLVNSLTRDYLSSIPPALLFQ